MIFNRQFAMPDRNTFSIKPISELLDRWLFNKEIIVDPFARSSKRGTLTNDLNPSTSAQYHLHACDFIKEIKVIVDVVLFDPPYSPRQISEIYKNIGRSVTSEDTQNAQLYRCVKNGLDNILKKGGIAICCGWNSVGFGIKRNYEMQEILLVTHGAAHNDTIVTVEIKR